MLWVTSSTRVCTRSSKHPCHVRMLMLLHAVVQITPFSYIWEKLWGVHDKPFWLRCVVRTPLRECSLTFPLTRLDQLRLVTALYGPWAARTLPRCHWLSPHPSGAKLWTDMPRGCVPCFVCSVVHLAVCCCLPLLWVGPPCVCLNRPDCAYGSQLSLTATNTAHAYTHAHIALLTLTMLPACLPACLCPEGRSTH